MKSDLIILTETWLTEGILTDEYMLHGYNANFNNRGRGKGIVSYWKGNFVSPHNINNDGFSISKMESEKIKVIGIYRSQDGDTVNLLNEIQGLVDTDKTTVIGGDINICALTQRKNDITKNMEEMGFTQLVTQATHENGRALDHIYIRQGKTTRFDWALEYFPKYYSDHDGIGLTMWES